MRHKLPLLLLSTALLAGCGEEAPKVKTPEQMKTGHELYDYYCRHCHKLRGPGELLEKRDQSRPPLANHQLMVLMQFGSEERHKGMPTFMDTDPEKLQLIANYVVTLQSQAEQ